MTVGDRTCTITLEASEKEILKQAANIVGNIADEMADAESWNDWANNEIQDLSVMLFNAADSGIVTLKSEY